MKSEKLSTYTTREAALSIITRLRNLGGRNGEFRVRPLTSKGTFARKMEDGVSFGVFFTPAEV